MNIHVEFDAATMAKLIGAPIDPGTGLIVKRGQPDQVLAATAYGNPLDENWLLEVELPSRRVVTWSGTMAGEMFDLDPRTWGRAGREAFNSFCEAVAPQLTKHGMTLCFHPHSRHVLSDVQSCVTFLRAHEAGPFEIALAPASLLEPNMLRDIEDHLTRSFETLGARCAMVILHDVVIHGADHDDEAEQRFVSVPLGSGLLPRETMLRLLAKHVPAATPLVISSHAIEQQIAWLTC